MHPVQITIMIWFGLIKTEMPNQGDTEWVSMLCWHLSTWYLSIQESCLRNIREDLRHYYKFLAGQFSPESSLRTSLLLSLKELMEVIYATSKAPNMFLMLGWATLKCQQRSCVIDW